MGRFFLVDCEKICKFADEIYVMSELSSLIAYNTNEAKLSNTWNRIISLALWRR